MSVAIVPVKHLSAGKSRLLPRLDRPALEGLSLAMLGDILDALLAAPSVERAAVVTPDANVAELAREAGAIALLRPDPGLNESIDAATDELCRDDEASLVILGDVAGALPEEIERLFEILAGELQGHGVVLAPSGDGGTSALLRAPARAIPSHFGPESARLHREAATRAGVAYREVGLASLAIDLDQIEDVERFLRSHSGGRRTRRQLAACGWQARSTPES